MNSETCLACGQRLPSRQTKPIDAGVPMEHRIMIAIADTVALHWSTHQLFAGMAARRTRWSTVRGMVADFCMSHPQSMVSRFDRLGLPSPKRYLSAIKLACMAGALEANPRRSISLIALDEGWAAPQNFQRFVRIECGMTATEFRRTQTSAALIEQMRVTLFAPYVTALTQLRVDNLPHAAHRKTRHNQPKERTA
jgi:hypothetical protein